MDFVGEQITASERATNFHNRAIAWLLHCGGYMYCDPMEACDVYTRQCSTLVTAVDLAIMGATLASGGINPVTDKRVIAHANVSHVLAEMAMEGVYTSSGDLGPAPFGLPAGRRRRRPGRGSPSKLAIAAARTAAGQGRQQRARPGRDHPDRARLRLGPFDIAQRQETCRRHLNPGRCRGFQADFQQSISDELQVIISHREVIDQAKGMLIVENQLSVTTPMKSPNPNDMHIEKSEGLGPGLPLNIYDFHPGHSTAGTDAAD